MQIKSIHIGAFGVLRNLDITPAQGLNIIEGGNDSGKTTLASFIRFMLYGFKNPDSAIELHHYANHETGTIEGSMIITSSTGTYRIDRRVTLGKVGDPPFFTLAIRDMDKDVLMRWDKSPGEILLGIPLSLFENAAFVTKPRKGVENGDILLSNIHALLFSPEMRAKTARAIAYLEEEHEVLSRDASDPGSIRFLSAAIESLQNRLTTSMSGAREVLRIHNLLENERRLEQENLEMWQKFESVKVAYENHLLLNAFEQLHATEAILEATRQEKDAFLQEYVNNSYLPDAAYEAEYMSRRDRWFHATEEVKEATATLEEIEAFEVMSADTRLDLIRADKHGGEDAVWHSYTQKRSRFALMIFLASLAFGVGLGLLLPVIFLAGSNNLGFLFILACIGSCLGLSGGAVCTILGHKLRTEMTTLCRDYHAKNGKELKQHMHAVTQGKQDTEHHITALSKARGQHKRAITEEALSRRSFVEHLAMWGRSLPETDLALFLQEFEQTLATCIATHADISAREDALAASVRDMADALSSSDEEELHRLVPERRRPMLRETNAEAIQKAIDEYRDAYNLHRTAASHYHMQVEVLEASVENPSELCEELCKMENLLESRTAYLRTVDTTLMLLNTAEENLWAGVKPKLAFYLKDLLDVMTGGKYPNMALTDDLSPISIQEGGAIPMDLMATGTQDAAYLALRLALIRLLFREAPPFLLDDSFAEQDDGRLDAILQVILALSKSAGMQTFIFTKYDREFRMASCHGTPNLISLS